MNTVQDKIAAHLRFWNGEGPGLILIPAARQEVYDLEDYKTRFRNPEVMWAAETRRAQPVSDWPTDGIPTVRPNLGVVFLPSMAGQSFRLLPDAMPWPGDNLDRDAIRHARQTTVATAGLMPTALEFYRIHRERGDGSIAAYHADTQGVFDIAHLLYGDRIFYDLVDDPAWMEELMGICLDLYVRTSLLLKTVLGEESCSMIHGHGTPQGVYFPHAGVRMSEDTATILSPEMIERFVVPSIVDGAAAFEGVFLHFCGHHKPFFERLCRIEQVRAIDLGNPEQYDTRWLLEACAQTGTVLCSRLASMPGETWEPYVRRIAGLVRETGARCILRPAVCPENRSECSAMLDFWHELTG